MSIHPEQHPLDGKLEPETKDCFNDRAPLYSIAISLKRIADAPSEAAARITELEARAERAEAQCRVLENDLAKSRADADLCAESWEREIECGNFLRSQCRVLERAWTWLAGRMNLVLDCDWPDEEDNGVWQVHRVSGGVNDREWELVGAGTTPLEAVEAARLGLSGAQRSELSRSAPDEPSPPPIPQGEEP